MRAADPCRSRPVSVVLRSHLCPQVLSLCPPLCASIHPSVLLLVSLSVCSFPTVFLRLGLPAFPPMYGSPHPAYCFTARNRGPRVWQPQALPGCFGRWQVPDSPPDLPEQKSPGKRPRKPVEASPKVVASALRQTAPHPRLPPSLVKAESGHSGEGGLLWQRTFVFETLALWAPMCLTPVPDLP